jgi:branched-chain amino acid transport system substrate-binding protein
MKRRQLVYALAGAALAASTFFGSVAHAAEELRILHVAPLSGNLKATGTWLNQSLLAYTAEAEKTGDLPFRINVKTVDDGYVPEKTLALAQEQMKAFKPQTMFGLVGTSNLKILLEKKFFDENDLFLVGARTGAPLYHPKVVHLRASYASEVYKLMEFAGIQGFDAVGVIYQGDDFGQDGLQAAQAFAAKNPQIKLVANAPYTRNTVEVGPAIQSMLAAKPKVVIVVGNTNASAAVTDALKKSGQKIRVFTLSATDPGQVVDKLKTNAQGLVVSQIVPGLYDPRFPLATEFRKFAERNKLPPNSTVFEGYVMAKVLIDSAKRVKGPLTSASLLKEIRSKPVNLGGLRLNLPDANRSSTFVDTLIVGSGNQFYY